MRVNPIAGTAVERVRVGFVKHERRIEAVFVRRDAM
jgi:hypothetical protein